MCPGSHCYLPPSPQGSVPAHPGAFSSLFFPSTLLCFLHPAGFSYPLDHGELSFRSLSLPWVPLAGVSALGPYYSVSLQHPLARSLQFSSMTIMPCQHTHRSMVQSYSNASISLAYLVAPSSPALVILPLVWCRMLGRERGIRHWADWALLLEIAGDWCLQLKPVHSAAILLLGWPWCRAYGQAGQSTWCTGWGIAMACSLITGEFPPPALHEHKGLDLIWKEKE